MENPFYSEDKNDKTENSKHFYQYKEEIVDELCYQTRENFIQQMSDLDIYLFSIGCGHTKFDALTPDLSFISNKYLWSSILERTKKLETEKPEAIESIRLWHRKKFEKILNNPSIVNETLAKKNEFYHEAIKKFGDMFHLNR